MPDWVLWRPPRKGNLRQPIKLSGQAKPDGEFWLAGRARWNKYKPRAGIMLGHGKLVASRYLTKTNVIQIGDSRRPC